MGNSEYYRYRDSSPFSEERLRRFRENRHKTRVFFGVAIAVTGIILILRNMGIVPCISLDDSWPYMLLGLGLLLGIKNNFRNNAWWILMLVGAANLTPQFMILGRPSTHFVWPAAIVVAGIVIAFRPRRDAVRCAPRRGNIGSVGTTINSESSLNIDSTFGGRKEVVTSKDFKGGVVSVTFAGCELNLTQADFTEPSVVIDCRVSFGGLEIIMPSHWELQNEINPSFGNVEDARTIQTSTTNDTKKILILRGNCSFGSIEIKSY
jgi:hypothetical protein